MKISIPVIDFGDIVLSKSTDNPECVRMEVPAEYESTAYVDLLPDEIDSLIFALKALRP